MIPVIIHLNTGLAGLACLSCLVLASLPAYGQEFPASSPKNPFELPALSRLATGQLAHAILVRANPDKEAVITDIPEEILLTFNEGVGNEYLALAVSDSTGKRVDKHDAHLDFTDHSHLRASLENAGKGRYTVRYRVLSADGHVVSGKYFFDIK